MVEAEVDSLFLPYCFNEVEFKSLSNLKLMLLLVVKRFMMDHLVFYESRAAAADPHRDMRLDIDNMSYEVSGGTAFSLFRLCLVPEILKDFLVTNVFVVRP
jgi:hypothetical protein